MLKVITGSMFAGKSTALINEFEKYEKLVGNNIIVVKPKIDTRSTNELKTHDNLKIKAIEIETKDELLSLKKYKVIIIDEVQFISEELVDEIVKLSDDRIVICAGLNMSFKRTPFKTTANLMALADEIQILKGTCGKCKTKSSTYISYKINPDNNVIDVGNEDKYIPLCKNCLLDK